MGFWGSVLGTALPIVGGAIGSVVLPGVGTAIGAGLGGYFGDAIENGGFRKEGILIGAASMIGGGVGGQVGKRVFLSGLSKKGTKRVDTAVKNAKNNTGVTGRERRNLIRAERAAAVTKSRPDSWRNAFNPGENRFGNVITSGKERWGAHLARGGGAGLGYSAAGSMFPPRQGSGSADQRQSDKQTANTGTGEWVGAHVQSAGKPGTPFVLQENKGPNIVNPAEPQGVLWQPAGLSRGMKEIWGGKTAAASSAPS
ncbi:hypothetical protein IU510_07320 [Nocardia cyriacigeorgica]|uniref:hypothetical protein n=1 Tax=Nocardia cyriacigeorgica TaxID=135487 RepID=UPI0018948BF6|nr:hypothetical protein [Nocardia cyriacigeorgica]MBF6097885.1 hypothetical protein [Nocardia cyriacigeorgica]MBF6158059.1 hypothetical protein [Nocardia cyriacigeorgica]MBF6197031.1 hypothetical protein [Nocardia cyriacigeorgica]